MFVSYKTVSNDTSCSIAQPLNTEKFVLLRHRTRFCSKSLVTIPTHHLNQWPHAVQSPGYSYTLGLPLCRFLWLYSNMIHHILFFTFFDIKDILSVATRGVLSLKCERTSIKNHCCWISPKQFLPMMHIAKGDNCSGMLKRSLEYFTHKKPPVA